jgi:hypothetical protein
MHIYAHSYEFIRITDCQCQTIQMFEKTVGQEWNAMNYEWGMSEMFVPPNEKTHVHVIERVY